MCFPNTGRLGGKSKVSDLNGWPSFKTDLKTKVKTGKFLQFFAWHIFPGNPQVYFVQKTKSSKIEAILC